MKNGKRTASNGISRSATEPDVAGIRRMGAASSGLQVGGPDRTVMDSIIVALLEDIKRAGQVENIRNVTCRVGPLDREELYRSVFQNEADEMNADEIAAGIALQAALASAERPPGKGRARITEPGTSGRIVIAEDDKITRMLLSRVLTRAGFTVRAFENGLLAYDAVRRNGADVVLLDWLMPIMDGPTAVARLKANRETRAIPIVMLTAQSDIEERVVALETGVQDFLTKPFDSRELIARIEQQLRWRNLLVSGRAA